MYPHFIEVEIRNGPKAIINIDNIKAVSPHPEAMDNTDIYYSVGGKEIVSESYDEVKGLIESSGAHINMGDPRLDQKHPLTMKDLEEMKSGEPVWNINRNEWYLLRTMTKDGEVWFSDFVGSKVIATKEMLIKTPLYRMKSNETNK